MKGAKIKKMKQPAPLIFSQSVSFNEVKESLLHFLCRALLQTHHHLFPETRLSISQVMTSSSVYFHGRAKFLYSSLNSRRKIGKENILLCLDRLSF